MSNHGREESRAGDRGSALDRAWQQASDEQPSPQLDAAILAAARIAIHEDAGHDAPVRTPPRSGNWMTRWQPLAAAAAVAGLAFVLVQSLPREPAVVPSLRVEPSAPDPAPATGKSRSPVTGDSRNLEQATATDRAGAQQSMATTDEHSKAGVSAAHSTTSAVAPPAPGLAATAKSAAAVAVPDVATAAASESRQVDAAPPGTAERSADIAALFAAGDVAAAADALRAFRAADPEADSYLPESLRDWAQTVR
jgi:hypothetical protein